MLYLDLEDLKQSKSDGGKNGERRSYSLCKEPIGCISPGEDYYYVGSLGQTHVLLPE